jgi:hypothetical protein
VLPVLVEVVTATAATEPTAVTLVKAAVVELQTVEAAAMEAAATLKFRNIHND